MTKAFVEQVVKSLIRPGTEVILYGSGRIGAGVLEAVRGAGSSVPAFLDLHAQKRPGESADDGEIPVYQPADPDLPFSKNTPVLLSLFCGQKEAGQLVQDLQKLGFQTVLYSKELLACFCAYGVNQEEPLDLKLSAEKICDALELMADEHSRELMIRTLQAYHDWDFGQVRESGGTVQYFDANVPFRKGFSHFIDCGAYIGDSLEEWLRRHKGVSYLGFEPDAHNFRRLAATAERLKDQVEELLLLPCAVSGELGYAKFSQSGGSGSRLSVLPEEAQVMTVRLDDILIQKKATMIKMDIEGAERSALEGGRGLIESQKPDLAVCVYHQISDLWEIPLMLREWAPEYRFYLRSHAPLAIETVLYATV